MIYQVRARNEAGIDGEVQLSNGKLVKTSHPLKGEEGFNPEELLALSWSTCLHATLKTILQEAGKADADSRVDVVVSLEKEELEPGYYFAVTAQVAIADLPLVEAQTFGNQAHQRCPVSKLLAGAKKVEVQVLPY